MVKSKAETFQSYVVQITQGEYRRNRLQLKEAAITITVPITTSTTTSITVQPTSVPLYTKDVFTKTYYLSRNYTIIIKGITMSQLNVPLTLKV